MIDKLEGGVRALAEYMSELSEEAYTAGWMDGLEYALWYAIENGPRKYGRLDINDAHIEKMKELSGSIGGWIYFDNKFEETFISKENWLSHYGQNIQDYECKIS